MFDIDLILIVSERENTQFTIGPEAPRVQNVRQQHCQPSIVVQPPYVNKSIFQFRPEHRHRQFSVFLDFIASENYHGWLYSVGIGFTREKNHILYFLFGSYSVSPLFMMMSFTFRFLSGSTNRRRGEGLSLGMVPVKHAAATIKNSNSPLITWQRAIISWWGEGCEITCRVFSQTIARPIVLRFLGKTRVHRSINGLGKFAVVDIFRHT